MTISLARLLFGICLVAASCGLRAAETETKAKANPAGAQQADAANAPAQGAAAAPNKDADVLELPKIEVTTTRTKELDREIKRLDKAIARERRNMKATDLDKVLNNPKLTSAAVVFGGNSSAYLEEVAATRVRYMETERELLSDMKLPRTLEELAMIKEELERIRTMRRELDHAGH